MTGGSHDHTAKYLGVAWRTVCRPRADRPRGRCYSVATRAPQDEALGLLGHLAGGRRRSRSRSRGAAAQRILQLRLLLVACGTVSLSSRRLSDPFDVSFKDCFDVAVCGDW